MRQRSVGELLCMMHYSYYRYTVAKNRKYKLFWINIFARVEGKLIGHPEFGGFVG